MVRTTIEVGGTEHEVEIDISVVDDDPDEYVKVWTTETSTRKVVPTEAIVEDTGATLFWEDHPAADEGWVPSDSHEPDAADNGWSYQHKETLARGDEPTLIEFTDMRGETVVVAEDAIATYVSEPHDDLVFFDEHEDNVKTENAWEPLEDDPNADYGFYYVDRAVRGEADNTPDAFRVAEGGQRSRLENADGVYEFEACRGMGPGTQWGVYAVADTAAAERIDDAFASHIASPDDYPEQYEDLLEHWRLLEDDTTLIQFEYGDSEQITIAEDAIVEQKELLNYDYDVVYFDEHEDNGDIDDAWQSERADYGFYYTHDHETLLNRGQRD